MIKKIAYVLSIIILSMAICYILINFYPSSVITYVTSAADDKQRSRLEEIYDVNFIMSKVPAGNMMIFLPAIKYCEYDEAESIAESFGLNGWKENFSQDNENIKTEDIQNGTEGSNYEEFEDRYVFMNAKEVLTVYKFGDRIDYERFGSQEAEKKTNSVSTAQNKERATVPISETEAADLCARFIIEKFPDFTYEEAEINFDGKIYEITYIGRLTNLRNFAFPTIAAMDTDGEILRLSLSFNDYDKLNDAKIKSMSDAYLELPVDFDEDIKIDLKKCALVYHYEDSLVQPAYMFEGEIAGGRNFKCFVNAAIYKY